MSREQGEKNFGTIKARIRARGIKIVREYSSCMSEKWKQPDHIHLTADGHKELARLLLPFVYAFYEGRDTEGDLPTNGQAGFKGMYCGIGLAESTNNGTTWTTSMSPDWAVEKPR